MTARKQNSWNAVEQDLIAWRPLYANEPTDLPPGALDIDSATDGGRCLTAWGRAVLNYRRQRRRHSTTSRHASIGFWVLQALTTLLLVATPLLVALSDYPTVVKAIPSIAASLLNAFNALVDWRGLARARQHAVQCLDREFQRFNERRHGYGGLASDAAITYFADEVERINDEADKVGWLDSRHRIGDRRSTDLDSM